MNSKMYSIQYLIQNGVHKIHKKINTIVRDLMKHNELEMCTKKKKLFFS